MENTTKKSSDELKIIIEQLKAYILEHQDRLNKDMVNLVKSW